MSIQLNTLIHHLQEWVPLSRAEQWDAVGLQISPARDEVEKVLIALDPSWITLKEARELGAQLIITHHPLLLKPLKSLRRDHPLEYLARSFIQEGIGLYVMHTNFDRLHLAREAGKRLGLCGLKSFGAGAGDSLYKLVVYVPTAHEEEIARALFAADAGHIGKYSHCSFRMSGTGTFMPEEGSTPFLGEPGMLERVQETRVETIVQKSLLKKTLTALARAHPYEEMAYDLIPLANTMEGGLGVVGQLPQPLSLQTLIQHLKNTLSVDAVRGLPDAQGPFETVALVPGKGGSFLLEALHRGADVLITGDVGHHDFMEARMHGIQLLDAGHFSLEVLSRDLIQRNLQNWVKVDNLHLHVHVSVQEQNPVQSF